MRKGYLLCRGCGAETNCADLVSGLCPACAEVHAAKLSELQRQYEAAVKMGEGGTAARVADLISEYENSEGLRLKDAHRIGVNQVGLFAKKCSVCGRKLPDKRRFKGVCDICGMNYKTLTKQMEDTLRIVNDAKTARTCYDRCLFGLRLCDRLAPYARVELFKYPAGGLEEQKTFFEKAAEQFQHEVWAQNEKRKFEKKVGLAPYEHYKKLQNPNVEQWKEGCCKACWGPGPINEAGYCIGCPVRATSIQPSELHAFEASKSGAGLEGERLIVAAITAKLKRCELENKG